MSVRTKPREPEVRILCGQRAILRYRTLLEDFAAQCGLHHALHWLPYFLGGRGRTWKHPSLAVMLRAGAREVDAESLLGATLFIEYRPLGVATGCVIADEVVAPPGDRAQVAATCAQAMIRNGAHSLAVLYVDGLRGASQPWLFLRGEKMQWATAQREHKQSMPIASTFDATLAQMGKGTRTNLRYYRKRFRETHTPEFVDDARALLSLADLLQLNSSCRNPVPEKEVRQRYEASVGEGGFLVGLRRPTGEWLSAIGGWRSGTTTVQFWQANADGYDRESLVTVMRTYFLEDEVRRGTERLTLFGGTSHSMRGAFDDEVKQVLFLRRKSLRARLLGVGASIFDHKNVFTHRVNMLAGYLRSPELRWHDITQPPLAVVPLPESSEIRAA